VRWGVIANASKVLTHGGMGYAQEYHVERYLREVFVPRIAPVSRVSVPALKRQPKLISLKEMIMNYIGEKALGLPRSY
jgi:acyl-CoA dehydrogenase